ncbi:MAG: replication initiation protein [Saprospiraceae bacterium]|nr:replication initiation protein [Saprospiraceae bacterium]
MGIAQRDLEEHTDIRFEYDEIKTVRKVSALKFRILANTPKQTAEEKQLPKNAVLSFLEEAVQIDDKPDLGETVRAILRGWEISDKSLQKFVNMGFNIITDDAVRAVVVERTGGSLEQYYLEKIEVVKNGRPRGGRGSQ